MRVFAVQAGLCAITAGGCANSAALHCVNSVAQPRSRYLEIAVAALTGFQHPGSCTNIRGRQDLARPGAAVWNSAAVRRCGSDVCARPRLRMSGNVAALPATWLPG